MPLVPTSRGESHDRPRHAPGCRPRSHRARPRAPRRRAARHRPDRHRPENRMTAPWIDRDELLAMTEEVAASEITERWPNVEVRPIRNGLTAIYIPTGII